MISTPQLIIELRDHLGVHEDDPDWDDSACLLILNRAFWEILNKFEFREKEQTVEFEINAGEFEIATNTVDIPNFEALNTITIIDQDGTDNTRLRRIGTNSYTQLQSKQGTKQAKPTHYMRRNDKIILTPVPDQAYDIILYYLLTLDSLEDSPEINASIPREWHEIILYGGVWRGFLKLGDNERQLTYKNNQLALINSTVPVESKEETDSSYAGLSIYPPNTRGRKLWK